MNSTKKRPIFLLATLLTLLLTASGAGTAVLPQPESATLLDTYHRVAPRLEKNSFGLPLYLESLEAGKKERVDLYGIFLSPFAGVASALKEPANWCDIVTLHPNVKACTYRQEPGGEALTFYFGRKFYQTPQESHEVLYHFRNALQEPEYLDILLRAESGPFGTRNHLMRFEALPLDARRTFVHVVYEYQESLTLRLAGKAYFATLGEKKIGFTVTGRDREGKEIFVDGPRGATERNAVRYYFAISTFLESLKTPEPERFSSRIGQWYDLIDRYRPQLFELEKGEYLAAKEKEHRNQLALQSAIGSRPPNQKP